MKKEILIVIRCLIATLIVTAAYPAVRNGTAPLSAYIIIGVYVATILGMIVSSIALSVMARFFKWLFVFDMLAVTLLVAKVGESHEEFYIAYFLAVLLSAAARSVAMSFAGAIVSSVFYTWLTVQGNTGVELLSMEYTVRVVLFYVVSLFVGYIAEETLILERIKTVVENKYRGLLEQSGIGVIVVDDQKRLLESDRNAETLLGVPLEKNVGKYLKDIFDEAVASVFVSVTDSAMPNALFDNEIAVASNYGDSRILDIHCSKHLIDGRLLNYIFIKDITKVKAIRTYNKHVERLATMGKMTAGLAHELNNPLTSIVGYAELLAKKEYRGDYAEAAKHIHAEASRIAKMIAAFLSFANDAKLEKTSMNVNAICEEVAGLWKEELAVNNIALDMLCTEGLPLAHADPKKIKDVLMNVITNGVESIGRKRMAGTITISTGRQNGCVKVTVSDTGEGIRKDIPDYFSMPFFSMKDLAESVSLGMSVSYGIMKEHGGDLNIEGREGGGTCVHMTIPVFEGKGRS